jgi:hypothetical protein
LPAFQKIANFSEDQKNRQKKAPVHSNQNEPALFKLSDLLMNLF